jgi:OH-DDVA oxygenase
VARITLGLGTSHGPMLSVGPEYWPERIPADKAHSNHPFRGKTYSFDELVALRKDERLDVQSALEARQERYTRCQNAIQELGDVIEGEKPDIAVIVGNDQMEIFNSDHVPAFAIFWGDYVEGRPRTPEFLASLPPGVGRAELDRTPTVETHYPTLPDLGRYLIEAAIKEGYDPAQLKRYPKGAVGENTAPHAYGFVYHRVMRGHYIPHVPVFVNTFYPPNQPRAQRCFEFGRMLARAIQAWPKDVSVAVFASGGLTHFVIDEKFDREVLEMLKRGDGEALANIPDYMYQSGTSEIKNWITVAGVMAEAGFKMRVLDYVPCYRSEAGTGTAHCFAEWR